MLLCYICHQCALYGSLKKSCNTNVFKHAFGFFTLNVFCNVCIMTLAITPKRIWSLPNWWRSWKLMKIKLYATSKLDEYYCNLTSGLWLNVECKNTWGLEGVCSRMKHILTSGTKCKKVSPMTPKVHSHYWSLCIHVGIYSKL